VQTLVSSDYQVSQIRSLQEEKDVGEISGGSRSIILSLKRSGTSLMVLKKKDARVVDRMICDGGDVLKWSMESEVFASFGPKTRHLPLSAT